MRETRAKARNKTKRPVPPKRTRSWIHLAAFAVVIYLAFQIYAPALTGPFVFDDRDLPYGSPSHSDRLLNWITGLRPVLMFSYWLNYRISKEPFGFHLVNVILHILNAVLLFFIIRKLLQWNTPIDNQGSNLIAGLAAAVFLVHPIQTESVAYIAGRSESLSVLFLFAAFSVFLYRHRTAVSWKVAIAVITLYLAAVGAKEHTLVFPVLLLLTDYYWNPGFSFRGILQNWRIYVPLALATAFAPVMVWRILQQSRSAGFALQDLTWYRYFFTECRAFFLYLRLLVFPANQNLDWDYPVSRNLFDHGAIFASLAILLLVGAAIYFRRRYPLASYGFLVYLLLMTPTSSFLPIQDPVAERRLYLPMIGMLLVAAAALRRIHVDQRKLALGGVGAVMLLGVVTWQRNRIWASETALWEDTVSKSPSKTRAHFQLAFTYYTHGRCRDAMAQYAVIARLRKPDYQMLVDWGLACECAGDPEQALVKLRESAALQPTAHVYSQIGLVYARQARWPDALAALARSEQLDSNYAVTYFYRGGVHTATRDFAAAVQDYERAVALDPGNQPARQGLEYARQQLMLPRR